MSARFFLVIAGVLPASGGANAKNRAGDQTSTIFLLLIGWAGVLFLSCSWLQALVLFSAEKTVEIVQKEERKIQDHGEIARVLQGSQAL